jgi:branched-chain amino acid transport system substrate-binding protein
MKKIFLFLSTIAIVAASQPGHAQVLIGQTAGFTGAVAAGVISMDDKFDPKIARENARILIEEKNVMALFLTRGTPHAEAIIPLLDKYSVPLIAPSTGAMVLHQPVRKNVFNVRATYQREAEKAVTHLSSMGITRIALVYVDDSFGADGVIGAQKGLATAKLKPAVLEKFDRVKPDFASIATKLVKAEVQSVIVVASGATVVEAVKAFRAAGSVAQIVTLSNNASSGFTKSLGDQARGVIVTQVFPSERSIAYPMVKEAMEMAKAKGQNEISPATLEGFAAAKVLVEGLRRAGPKPTREKLQAGLESIQKLNLGGLDISYSAEDHTGLDFADLSIIGTDGQFKR